MIARVGLRERAFVQRGRCRRGRNIEFRAQDAVTFGVLLARRASIAAGGVAKNQMLMRGFIRRIVVLQFLRELNRARVIAVRTRVLDHAQ